MKTIEYLYCCINKFGSSNDTIYNYSTDLSLDDVQLMKDINNKWVPNFKLYSIDEKDGVVFTNPENIDLKAFGNAYYYALEEQRYVFAFSKIRENTIDIPAASFRGKKYVSHILIVDEFSEYAVDMIDASVLKKNLVIEMDGIHEVYATDEELKDHRLPQITELGEDKEYNANKFANNQAQITSIISNVVYAKENGLKCYINYNKKSDYENVIELFRCAIKLLPVKYANKIGFSINNANCMLNNEFFDVMIVYSTNQEVISFINNQTCHVNIGSDNVESEFKNVGFEDLFKNISFDSIIDYVDLISKNKDIDNIADLLKIINVFYLFLRKYSDDSSNLDKTINEVIESISIIKANYEMFSEMSEMKDACYKNIKSALDIAFTNPNISPNAVETLFNNLLDLNDPKLFDVVLTIASRDTDRYKYFRTLVECKNDSLKTYIISDGWDVFYETAINASKNTKIPEAINMFIELYKDFSGSRDLQRTANVINYVVENDDDGFEKILEYDLSNANEPLIDKVRKILNFISELDDTNQKEFEDRAYKCFRNKISLIALSNVLCDLNNNTNLNSPISGVINTFINRLLEEEFASGDDIESIKKALIKYNGLLDDQTNKLSNFSIQRIEDYLCENVVCKIKDEMIKSISLEYISTKTGNQLFELILKLAKIRKNNRVFADIIVSIEQRMSDFEQYKETVQTEKKYTVIRTESILRCLKRIGDSVIVKILDEFAVSYKNRDGSFSLELQERNIKPNSSDPNFYPLVDDVTRALLGSYMGEDEFMLKAEMKAEEKKKFALRVDAEFAKIQDVDYKTAIGDTTGALFLCILLVALMGASSIGLSYYLMKNYTQGSFKLLFTVLSCVVTASPIIFYACNFKQRRLHNAFLNTLWQSLSIFILVFGLVFLILCLK